MIFPNHNVNKKTELWTTDDQGTAVNQLKAVAAKLSKFNQEVYENRRHFKTLHHESLQLFCSCIMLTTTVDDNNNWNLQ